MVSLCHYHKHWRESNRFHWLKQIDVGISHFVHLEFMGISFLCQSLTYREITGKQPTENEQPLNNTVYRIGVSFRQF